MRYHRLNLLRWVNVTLRVNVHPLVVTLHYTPLLWGFLEVQQFGAQGQRIALRRWDWGPVIEMEDA